MEGGQVMVIVIVAIVMVGSIIKAGVRNSHHHIRAQSDNDAQLENRQLRSEVSELKERLKVLERITVEKENSLAKEIESLRDR